MSPAPPPKGIYAPCLSFFNEDESLDLATIKKHAVRLAKSGVTGLVVHGSNGEAPHLDHSERSAVISAIRTSLTEAGFPHMPIIAGTGVSSARETVVLCEEAATAGATHALVLPPSYWPGAMGKPNLTAFFTHVADKSPIPILLYNFPLVTSGIDIDSDTIIALAAHPNIVGCKLTCGNLGKLHRVSHAVPSSSFACLGGKSEFLLHGLVGGSSGTIGALVNFVPAVHVELMKRWEAGDVAGAKELQDVVSDADWSMSKLGVSGLKAAVSSEWDYGSGRVRVPLLPSVYTVAKQFEAVLALEKSFLK
ncbi:4-hydroxy-2-oxoglutarate aldolase, partial [Phenoliferia sp. Uapishka_3]